MQRGVKSVLIQSPTGSGKTLLTAHMLGSAAERGLPSWFICHRRELIKQSDLAFSGEGINHGIIAANFLPNPTKLVQIASIQTLIRRFRKYRVPSLIVWDECHHIAANSWSQIFSTFPNSFHIGLTATPERLDGTGLNKWFRQMVKGPTVEWLIKNGFLSNYKLYAPSTPDLTKVRTRMGDYVGSELTAIVDKPSITGDAISHYKKLAFGKRAVVFCASIAHSKHVVQQFAKAGIPAAHVDGETANEERDFQVRRFKKGEIKILSNVELFGEGFDVPAIEAAILLRPTQSLGLFLQQVGRSLRPLAGKGHAIILDHAGNCARHGLPDDEREWTLEGRERRRKGKAPEAVRVCPKCFGAQTRARTSCQYCEFVFEISPREVEEREGELSEVDVIATRKARKREQGQAQSLEALIALGKSRGYKNPHGWAWNILRVRKARVKNG
jgi:superfamily II DNA or RNA helicase